ncbi:hypothetical protein K2173_024538 [Erythroxylum novogranatense]|uniref:Small-subunit processome Utp12 domain-containing protein n=1 Tax=Erythroxylum novogranatense TaxID=1862640 RepID=A0AAV8SVD1_9ROSI|nr:hypothetical protein K2173_024538 [Erythroxylum novogranatense]
MEKHKLNSLITSFTPDGELLAILSPDGAIKIWNTSNGSLMLEWRQSDVSCYSCMACSFVGKKRKKGSSCLLLALGTTEGDVCVVDAFTGVSKWKSSACHPGGVVGLAFARKGRSLHTVGSNGMASERNSESAEVIREWSASKKAISSSAFSSDETMLTVVSNRTRILSLEDGTELLKFSNDLGPVQLISMTNNAKLVITSGFREKYVKLWWCELSSKIVSAGPVLSIGHPPLVLECKNKEEEEDNGVVVLALSQTGTVHVWDFKSMSQDEVRPTNIAVKSHKSEMGKQKDASGNKRHSSIFAAKLQALSGERKLKALIAYGLPDSPQFSVVDISSTGENIIVTARDEAAIDLENGILAEEESTVASTNRQLKKKRDASEFDVDVATKDADDTDHGEAIDGVLVQDDMNEPTMGEKLASLNQLNIDNADSLEKQESPSHAKTPSADSVNILLKQALHADDRALLLDCLYTQDEKVIANSVSQLRASDVIKLLHSLISIIQSRGAILACALPWLRNLLLHHASGIMSQQSSLLALNSLYQLIESRVSTFQPALQLSICLDTLYAGVVDYTSGDNENITPAIYEDNDESDEAESDDAMETDQESNEDAAFGEADYVSDIEGSDDMSE